MGNSSSLSSSSTTCSKRHDVFLSFRGEDTRNGFTSHLYAALRQKQIKTFIDYELARGDEISPALLRAIKESKVSVVIFSENYVSSKWCLCELAEIMNYKKMNKLIVIPVFYQINPSVIRMQIETFKDVVVKHDRECQEEVQKWREALTEASRLSGWDSSVTRPESELIDNIVKDIWKKLKSEYILSTSDFEGLVGIDKRIEQVISLLCLEQKDFRIIGIWGMGGIGKTTIVDAIFKLISGQFEEFFFIRNVGEQLEGGGKVNCSQHEVHSEVLGSPTISPYIKGRLNCKRVLIVLDDVNNFRQLEELARGVAQFGLGSRIIITTRDKQVLYNCGVNYQNIYEVEGFNHHEALQLFYKCAFKQNHPTKDLMVLSKELVNYAKGNPLALKVLGLSLNQKSEQEWRSAVEKLQRVFNPVIFDVLKISYDRLDDEENDLFLDIACFFNGECKDQVANLLGDCYFSLSNLVAKSLVMISNNNIQMHHLLQEMGREIVRKECPHKPGNRSRLCKQEDVIRTLKNDNGTEAVQGIVLDMSNVKDIHLSSRAFEKMHNLRVLKFYNWSDQFQHLEGFVHISKVHLPDGINYFPDELRLLQWHGYPLKVLPSNFIPEKLVELDLSHSNVEQLWEGTKHAPNLKRLILGYCRHLARIPDLFDAPLLEKMYLMHCSSLVDIPSSVQHLNNLRYLNMSGCKNLMSFPSNIHFRSLISLDLCDCINLMKFPQISGDMKWLDLSGTAIEEIPSSIQSLVNLVEFHMKRCARLKQISSSICKLKSLEKLFLTFCSKLESFPEITETMERLRILDLWGTAIKELPPPSIKNLNQLSQLYFG